MNLAESQNSRGSNSHAHEGHAIRRARRARRVLIWFFPSSSQTMATVHRPPQPPIAHPPTAHTLKAHHVHLLYIFATLFSRALPSSFLLHAYRVVIDEVSEVWSRHNSQSFICIVISVVSTTGNIPTDPNPAQRRRQNNRLGGLAGLVRDRGLGNCHFSCR